MQMVATLTIDDAKRIAAAALAEASRGGWNVVVAVVDEGGHLVYLERMDGTQKASSIIAVEKARTAILFKRPSAALEKAVQDGRIVMTTLPGATPIEGGVPLVHDGHFIGAIGVSGVQSHQDGQIAAAGAGAL